MQDFTGVPAVVDLAAMRDAMEEIGGDPAAINPLVDVDLVIDHSVQVDAFGNERAFAVNAEHDFERNRERYSFLKWGQQSFDNFRVVPPATGICHQVNLEHLAQVVYSREAGGVLPRLPRHPGRHRLAHDDGQRARRARLGRGRDRGRGGDARPADLDAAAAGRRLQARRRAAGGGDRDRPRPHRDRDAARARRRLQVRRVLRPRPLDPGAGRPGDARQHVAGVRLDLRDLPGRRRDPALPRPHRPPDRDDRAGRRLRPRAGHVPRRVDAGPGLLRPAGARPGRGRAQHRRAQAPAGPGAAVPGQGVLSRGDGRVRPRGGGADGQRPRRGDRGVLPGLRPAGRGPRRRARQAAAGGERRGRAPSASSARRDRGDPRGRRQLRARPRPGRDRRDHQLHQHLQPQRHGRRRPARPQRGRSAGSRASPG